jgi:general secretion pathway protein I
VARFACTDRRLSRQRAFTLLEVLVALVIVGVALAASMRGTLSLISAAEDTRYTMLATMLAENRLLELRLARESLDIGQSTTPCAQASVDFECEQTVRSTPNPYFRRVEVQVFRTTGDGRRRHAEMMAVLPAS